MTDPIAAHVDNVSLKYRLYSERNDSIKSALMRRTRGKYKDFWALRNVSIEVVAGSTLGLIGRNGSGKSTLLKTISRILEPDEGTVRVNGRIASLLEVGSGFHPELSGRENIFLNGSILGVRRKQLTQQLDEIIDFSGVREFIDQPVKNYSSGMYVRLGFAVAIHTNPDILIVDEVLAVGDAAFREKCRLKFLELRAQGKTIILVSHSMHTIVEMCDTAVWMQDGQVMKLGEPKDVVAAYEATVAGQE